MSKIFREFFYKKAEYNILDDLNFISLLVENVINFELCRPQ